MDTTPPYKPTPTQRRVLAFLARSGRASAGAVGSYLYSVREGPRVRTARAVRIVDRLYREDLVETMPGPEHRGQWRLTFAGLSALGLVRICRDENCPACDWPETYTEVNTTGPEPDVVALGCSHCGHRSDGGGVVTVPVTS